MAVSEIVTHKLLNAWQQYMRVNPWHFNQIAGTGTLAPLSEPGDVVWVQPERDELAEGISHAIAVAVPFLKTFHRPVYTFEDIPFTSGWPGAYGAEVKARYRHIQAIGRRGVTLIEADAPVVYSDVGGGGVDNRATVTVTLPSGVTDPTQVRLFFKQADSLAAAEADDRWEIEPVTVSIAGGVATITGHRSLFANPALWRNPYRSPNYNRASIEDGATTDAGDFITAVDVYRIYPDTTDAVTYLASPALNCTDCEYSEVAGSAYISNSELGLIRVCSNCNSWPCYGFPRYVRVHYLAGFPLDPITLQPDANITRAFIRLANAKMPYMPPDRSDVPITQWLEDFKIYPSGELPPALVNNPFGVKVGEVEAYRMLDPYASIGGGAGGW